MDGFRAVVEWRDPRFKAVMALAERCEYERGHSQQVTYLALRLFDELAALHDLNDEARFWLQCAAVLHDIGWLEGQSQHHKTSLALILDALAFPFDARERLIIGSIARYHRKALPSQRHEHFAALNPADQATVRVLAALLRVADGLDRTHYNVVRDLSCEVLPDLIIVHCDVHQPAHAEQQVAWEKGDLLAQVFDRRLFIKCYAR
ncbi:MAG: HD domain-containing protein [Anaerolineae bacterium]|nr:HD domain-containing protein [Anaerolineae bacterium]